MLKSRSDINKKNFRFKKKKKKERKRKIKTTNVVYKNSNNSEIEHDDIASADIIRMSSETLKFHVPNCVT